MKISSNLKNLLFAALFLMLNTLYFGSGNSFGENGTLDNVKMDFSVLSDKVILFGHQSVGQNIIEGMRSIKNLSNDVFVKKIEDGNPLDKGRLNHIYLGNNGDPVGKIE